MSVELSINGEECNAAEGASLFECAESLGIKVPTSCRKQGKCKECLIEVTEGMDCLSEPVAEEQHLRENFRLSCRCRIVTEAGRVRCHTMRRGAMRIERHALHLPQSVQNIDLDPAITRDGEHILMDGREIDRGAGPIHGVAMDLGTTTVVLRLFNLESGELVADASFENPQRFGGSDVLARIQYDTEHGGRLLQRVLLGYLSHALAEFPVDASSIYELVLAGNSTMRDLFFGLNVYSIGQKPYQSLIEQELNEGKRSTTSLSTPAKKLRLPAHPEARVYGVPLISGHVGADAAACLLASGLMKSDRPAALMDIGTNTELLVGNRDRLLVASCPAGPAFEGGGVSCGMPALEGALEAVQIADDGTVTMKVIGDAVPQGICGSGLVELLGELRRTGRMNKMGRLANGAQNFIVDSEHGITLTEEDISQLAQAKAANVAGLQIVLKNYGIHFNDIEVFYLAGGFAKHLNLDAARRMGLIPQIPDEKIIQVGNASIEGATLALLSASRRCELEEFVKRAVHVELETDENFFDHFVDGCRFVPVESTEQLK